MHLNRKHLTGWCALLLIAFSVELQAVPRELPSDAGEIAARHRCAMKQTKPLALNQFRLTHETGISLIPCQADICLDIPAVGASERGDRF